MIAAATAWSAPADVVAPGCQQTLPPDAISTAGTSTFVHVEAEACAPHYRGAMLELSETPARIVVGTPGEQRATLLGDVLIASGMRTRANRPGHPRQLLLEGGHDLAGTIAPGGEAVLALGGERETFVRRAAPGLPFAGSVRVPGLARPSAVAVDATGAAIVLGESGDSLSAAIVLGPTAAPRDGTGVPGGAPPAARSDGSAARGDGTFASVAAPLGLPRLLTRRADEGVLAAAPDGTVVAAWLASRHRKPRGARCWWPPREVWAAVRPPGGTFGAPRRISYAVGHGVVTLRAASGPGARIAWDAGAPDEIPPCPPPVPRPKQPARAAATAEPQVQSAALVPGGLGPTQVIARGTVSLLDVAVGAGHTVYALRSSRRATALVFDATGKACPPADLGEEADDPLGHQPRGFAAIDALGRATITWPVERGRYYTGRFARSELGAC
ncbi:hypothetical protein OJ997_21915 [Solirubrobacter phytolaccae]|uniref:Uncharacterized protein n=1 Tax=Solirubrobacter phytolaccae TaxID=1404360 RepID=A0A9X3NKC9_9ACTN|nr:hypothetical protein [Solirubrobacter phytolaccae]MDA0182982.1 hypothetical protein [Solirubrobacter phytolaccae]